MRRPVSFSTTTSCRIVLALALSVAFGCSGPPTGTEARAGAGSSPLETGPPPDLEELWASCVSEPEHVSTCTSFVRLSRDDPRLPARLMQLAEAHPGLWVPRYLEGYWHQSRREFDLSVRTYEEAVEIARSSGNPLGEGTALFALAALSERVGDAAGAARRVLEARDPAVRSGDRKLQAIVLDWLADRLETEARYFDERPLRRQILDVESVEKGGPGYRKALYDLAENARCLGLRSDAERGFTEALRSAREAGSAALESSAAMGLGILAAEGGETGRALELLAEASAAASRARNPRLEWFGEMLAGMTLLWGGRVEEARERLQAMLLHPGCDSDDHRRVHHTHATTSIRTAGRGLHQAGRARRIGP